jgi:hypothetical protein
MENDVDLDEGEGENSYHNLDFAPATKLIRWQIDLDDFEKSQDQIITVIYSVDG